MPRPLTLLAHAVAGLPLLALGSACDGGGDGPTPDRDAIRGGLAALFAGDHPSSADRADGDCFARQLVVRATPAQLRDAGVLDSSYRVVPDLPPLPEQMARQWVDAEFACVDFVERSAQAQSALGHGRVDEAAYAACLRSALDEDALRAAVVDTLTGDWHGADISRYSAAQARCAGQAGH